MSIMLRLEYSNFNRRESGGLDEEMDFLIEPAVRWECGWGLWGCVVLP